MTSKLKKILASLLALAALALGGAAIASATNGGPADEHGSQEKEAPDPGEAVSPAIAAKAGAAAVARTGGTVQEVNAEANDGPEQGGEQGSEQSEGQDAEEQDSPTGAAYEVDLTKGSTEYKVSLDKQFNVLRVQTEQAD